MENVVSEMFTLCADDLVVGLGLLSKTLEFMCTDIIDVDDSSVGLLYSLVLL